MNLVEPYHWTNTPSYFRIAIKLGFISISLKNDSLNEALCSPWIVLIFTSYKFPQLLRKQLASFIFITEFPSVIIPTYFFVLKGEKPQTHYSIPWSINSRSFSLSFLFKIEIPTSLSPSILPLS